MSSIQHIAFNCKKPEKLEDFYINHFGFKRVNLFKTDQYEFPLIRNGSTCIELHPVLNNHENVYGGEQTIGFKHLAFEVDNLEKKIKELQTVGIEVEPVIDCSALIKGMQVCFFNDPEGNRIELMKGYKDLL